MPIVPTTSETNKEGLLAHLSLGGEGQLGQQWKTTTEKEEKKDRKEGEKEGNYGFWKYCLPPDLIITVNVFNVKP